MIEVDKDNKIIHEKLEGNEIIYFMTCLTVEKLRHEKDIEKCYFYLTHSSSKVEKVFWNCSVKRHYEDIDGINKTLKYLSEKIEGWIKC